MLHSCPVGQHLHGIVPDNACVLRERETHTHASRTSTWNDVQLRMSCHGATVHFQPRWRLDLPADRQHLPAPAKRCSSNGALPQCTKAEHTGNAF